MKHQMSESADSAPTDSAALCFASWSTKRKLCWNLFVDESEIRDAATHNHTLNFGEGKKYLIPQQPLLNVKVSETILGDANTLEAISG